MNEICIEVECFNLKYTLECGQCFRWKKIVENNQKITYTGIVFDRVIKITQIDNILYVTSSNMDNLKSIILKYFDLNTSYVKIENEISKIDDNVNKAVKNSTGIRILKQDFFEMIISYIISANNNIPRISKSILDISKKYGNKIMFENEEYYLFPTLEQLSKVTEEEFKMCKVGFRARYLKNTIKYIIENKINFNELNNMQTSEIKEILMKMQGIGEKVADCILLFAFSRKEVFPIDVWVERVMSKLYFVKLDGKVSKRDILNYARNNFKEYAGIVQQHLFFNIREKLI